MACISTTTFNIIWNSEKTDSFKPFYGLRQSDPLALYLFVLCLENLCQLIEDKMDTWQWITIRAKRSGPFISHLFFIGDILLCGEATEVQMDCMINWFHKFCNATGQKVSINIYKTKIFSGEKVEEFVKK